ncbi:hypothetical protein P8452_08143 [Trifolium repens]|nr:hypothetical protein P8452_08143 [Trifolium repens]
MLCVAHLNQLIHIIHYLNHLGQALRLDHSKRAQHQLGPFGRAQHMQLGASGRDDSYAYSFVALQNCHRSVSHRKKSTIIQGRREIRY